MPPRSKQPEAAIIDPGLNFGTATDRIVGIPLRQGFARPWLYLFGAGCTLSMVLLVAIAWTLYRGVGIWGVNIPVAWGFAIINFVWWIGIGHAGTLISAILLLMRQEWRTSINRFAEAMTLFAVAMAGLFPLLHLGRFWKFYYLLPYPDTMNIYPQWRSPLVWDVFAVMTYGLVSLLFWYLGLVPDLATMRDTARRRWVRVLSGYLSLGWRGSARHWQRHQVTYLLLAGLATPLVVSVHSIVSLDFAVAIVPGWHVTLFPPYFVAGAIFSGMSMVLTIALPLRWAFRLDDLITVRHLSAMAKVMLAAGLIVAYGYIMENFTAALSASEFELFLVENRALGPYGPWYIATLICNVVVAQALWIRWVRTRAIPLFLVAVVINVGMWLERYVIVVVSLHRDFLPSSWGLYDATHWDWMLFVGTLGLFLVLLLLFIRLLPMVSIYEVRELLHSKGLGHGEQGGEDQPRPACRGTDGVGAEGHEEGTAHRAVAQGSGAGGPLHTCRGTDGGGKGPGEADRGGEEHGVVDGEIFGMAAEFDRAEDVVQAAEALRDRGYSKLDAYTPFPVEDLPAALGVRPTRMPAVFLVAALMGAVGIYLYQYYTSVWQYPWVIGGKPLHSWPSFVPLTFEVAVLSGAVMGFVVMLVRNRLPQPYHPMSNVPGFERASRDRFFLSVEAGDPLFERAEMAELLWSLGALQVVEVPLNPREGS